jgi:CheY-like chemotaxis protein
MFHWSQMKTQGSHGLQILVVDDETTVSRAIKMLLEHEGHTVQTADSAETALSLYAASRFDLVITDYSMGGMDGGQLAVRIKELRPGQPIIMATAAVYNLDVLGPKSGGVDFLLNKPFTLAELRDAIARVMSRPPVN